MIDRSLAAFQRGFAAALADPSIAAEALPADVARLVAQPGFAVYRNTTLAGCIDALAANYPAVARIVGDEWFRACAAVFVRTAWPAHAPLVDYGAGFPAFLARFPPAEALCYLPGVARLDRCFTEAHLARDALPVDAD